MGRRIILLLLLFAGLAASFYVAGKRAKVEFSNRAVEVVVDYDEVQQVAAATGGTPVEVLERFREAGATSVAITEQTFGEALDKGLLIPYASNKYDVDPAIGKQIAQNLNIALPDTHPAQYITKVQTEDEPVEHPYTIIISSKIPKAYLEQMPIGLAPDALEAADKADMPVVARLVSYPGATPDAVEKKFASLKQDEIDKIIFSGDQVLGFKGAVEETAEALEEEGLYFGRVEFAKQKGDFKLADEIPGRVITVHSINTNEMASLDVPSIVERFQRAVKERGVKIIYLRMHTTASEDLLASNVEFVSEVVDGVEAAGYTPKVSRPVDALNIPVYLRVVAAIGVAAGAMMLLLSFFDLSVLATALWLLLTLAICASLAAVGEIGRKAVALLSSVVFPTLAVIGATRGVPDFPKRTKLPLLRGILRLVGAVMVTVAGGVLIVGLLSSQEAMLNIDKFLGVKLAHLLPILILAFAYVTEIAWHSDTWTAQKLRIRRNLRQIGENPLLIWQAVGLFAVVAVVGVMLARSGNEPGVGVSELELKFRSLLDQLLIVRPRTKEFLVGYPALILGVAFALRGRREWAAPLVVIGAIGLVSALNTFCHLHTPLAVSVLRTVNGITIGAIFGAIAYFVFRNLPGRE